MLNLESFTPPIAASSDLIPLSLVEEAIREEAAGTLSRARCGGRDQIARVIEGTRPGAKGSSPIVKST